VLNQHPDDDGDSDDYNDDDAVNKKRWFNLEMKIA
jgi:hypothetical protein